MIKITKAQDAIKVNNLIITVFALPGIGKTTLSLTADKPLLLDADGGIIRAAKKGDSIRITNWEQDIESITVNDIAEYNTIIIDTSGRLCEIIAEHIMQKNPKLKNGNSLSLKGFGDLSAIFRMFLNKLKSFNKDIILIAHAKESGDDETATIRIDTLGSSKMEIYKQSDAIGYLSIKNNMRVLNFNPTDSTIGKNCAQLPIMNVPDISENPNFMADVIKAIKTKLNTLTEEQLAYEILFNEKINIIDCAESADNFNKLLKDSIILTNIVLKKYLHSTAIAHHLEYDSDKKHYVKTKVA